MRLCLHIFIIHYLFCQLKSCTLVTRFFFFFPFSIRKTTGNPWDKGRNVDPITWENRAQFPLRACQSVFDWVSSDRFDFKKAAIANTRNEYMINIFHLSGSVLKHLIKTSPAEMKGFIDLTQWSAYGSTFWMTLEPASSRMPWVNIKWKMIYLSWRERWKDMNDPVQAWILFHAFFSQLLKLCT